MKFKELRQINLAVAGVDQNPNIVPPAAGDKWVISDRKYSQPDSQLDTILVAVEFPNSTDTGTIEVFLYDETAENWVATTAPRLGAKHLHAYRFPMPPGTYFVALTSCTASTGTAKISAMAVNGYQFTFEEEIKIGIAKAGDDVTNGVVLLGQRNDTPLSVADTKAVPIRMDAAGHIFIHQQNGVVTATGSAALALAQAISGANIKINWIGLALDDVDAGADALVATLTDASDNIVAELWRLKPSVAPDGEKAFVKHFPNGLLLPDGYKIKVDWANGDTRTYRLTVAYDTPDKI